MPSDWRVATARSTNPLRSTAGRIRRRRAEQIVRFARPNILFYDERVIDLCHRIRALYRMRKIQKERKSRTAISPTKTRRMRRRFFYRFSKEVFGLRTFTVAENTI
jgi:hypothetical protein